MSDLLSGLMNQFGGSTLSQLSQSIGGDEEKTQSALQSALPVLLSALANNSSTPEGAQSLNKALEKDHDGSILENLSGFLAGGNAENMGSSILKHVLGSKTPVLEQHVAQKTGLSSDKVSALIKIAAPVIMGYLAKQKSQLGGDSGSLTDLLKSSKESAKATSSENQSFIESLLDQNKDGSIVDDVTKMGMSFLGNMFKK